MCQSSQQKYTAVSGAVNVQTANTNLDGSGTLSTLITGANEGTVVKTIAIKAVGSNAQGMIRLFIQRGQTAFLWREIPVPAQVQSATVPGYQTTIRLSYLLRTGDIMSVTTENSENWNFVAEGVTWENCTC